MSINDKHLTQYREPLTPLPERCINAIRSTQSPFSRQESQDMDMIMARNGGRLPMWALPYRPRAPKRRNKSINPQDSAETNTF